jgi:nucleoside-diphosphate-sugar epimerase
MKVAITGATGFIGRTVAADLRAAGHEVRALARDESKARDIGVDVIKGDLSDSDALARLLDGADGVIHLAGAISATIASDFFRVNEDGTHRMAQAAAKGGVTRFIHVSSLAAREPHLSDYARSKRAGETAVEAMPAGVRHIILRPCAVYGPGDRATLPLIKALTASPAVLPGTPAQRFSLIYVGDVARIAVAALGADATGIFEIDDGRPQGYSWEDIASIASAHERHEIRPYFLPRPLLAAAAGIAEPMSRLMGRPAMLTRGKVNELYHADWVVKGRVWPLNDAVGFVEGFARTVSWYRGAGWLPPLRQRTIKQASKPRVH